MPHSRTAELVCLLDADPDLGLLLSDERRAQAQRELVVRTYRLALGAWDVSRLAGASADHLGILILHGVFSRELVLADQVSTELLGAGDLVRPWPSPNRTTLMPVQAIWSVLSSATVAILDRRFAADAA